MIFVPPSRRRPIARCILRSSTAPATRGCNRMRPWANRRSAAAILWRLSSRRPASAVGPSQSEAMSIASAVQTGNVVIHNRAATKPGSTTPASTTNGTAERASYDGQSQILTLTGGVHLDGENGSLVAPTVSLNQITQDAEASGGVQATFQNSSPKTPNPSPNAKPEPVTHVLAASAHFDHATRFATFYGTDAAPARMWQDASQVQAATLLFDGIKRTFSARPGKPDGLVHAILASNASPPKPGSADSPAQHDPRRQPEDGLQRSAARGDLLRRRHDRWHDGRSPWTTCCRVPRRCSCSSRNASRVDFLRPTESVQRVHRSGDRLRQCPTRPAWSPWNRRPTALYSVQGKLRPDGHAFESSAHCGRTARAASPARRSSLAMQVVRLW